MKNKIGIDRFIESDGITSVETDFSENDFSTSLQSLFDSTAMKVKEGWMVKILFGSHPEDGDYTLPKIYESKEHAEKAFKRYQLNYGESLVFLLMPVKFISK